ncbi:nucleotidyl transferase AbiEii/AbiGii toxin family protein [Patescibacteria group bacterium]|nr:nucleotidyl transferase AbiEii/AbiGii toxin family protein [Patescibacteria group bacterium]
MLKLHLDILDKKRLQVFQQLQEVCQKNWILGGGTAIALQLNHRKSYDFDIFLPHEVPTNLLTTINQAFTSYKIRPTIDTKQELSLLLTEQIKLTFFCFPFPHLHPPIKSNSINLFSLTDLASNKAYVIGRRGEWKDYVDLYFCLLGKHVNIYTILKETEQRFKGNFDKKLFWEQLVYYQDLKDFKIDYVGKTTSKNTIQNYFEDLTKTKF